MNVEKKFVRNYLSKQKYQTGKLAAFFILTLCLVASMFYWDTSYSVSSYLSADKGHVFNSHEYWRLFTTSFIHGDIEHLMSNSLMLFILTYFVTAFYGASLSLGIGFLMGIVINSIVILQYGENTTLVGASGVIYYLWGFWLVLYVCITKHLSIISRLIRVFGIFLILLVPTTYSPSTSYLAHYIGFILGAVIGAIYYFVRRKYIASFEFWEYRVVPDFEEQDRLLEESISL